MNIVQYRYKGMNLMCIIILFSMVAPLSVYAADSDEKAFVNVSKLAGASTWVLFVGSLSVALISVKEDVNSQGRCQ